MTNRVQATFLTSFSSPVKHDKVYWKGIAILGAFGSFLVLAFYLYGRLSVKTDIKPNLPAPSLTAKQVRKQKLEALIQSMLSPNEYLGEAIDNGDCFYHALSNALEQIGVHKTPKELRMNISSCLQDSNHQLTFKHHIEQDSRGVESFEKYQKYVGYTNEELTQLRFIDLDAPTGPYWGDPSREGLLLCQMYGFNLRIISAGFQENKVENDPGYKKWVQAKEEAPEGAPILQTYEDEIQKRLVELYNQDGFYFTGDDTYPIGDFYQNTCTLALFENHFVPVLQKNSLS
ncbi:MAG: hypothetical protein KBA81_03825 [Rhabdochlamydiaceae bacterium]|nr:hypothetical protein [Rhabdochlamydiaceae bacterium]